MLISAGTITTIIRRDFTIDFIGFYEEHLKSFLTLNSPHNSMAASDSSSIIT